MKLKTALSMILCVIVFFAMMFTGMYLSQHESDKPISITGTGRASEEEIIIELKGEVKSPGKYSVPLGTPLHDVIYMADGLTKDGDPKSVNLAQLMTVPCTVTVAKSQGHDYKPKLSHSFGSDNRCNINTATLSELTSLPGVGEALALDIINYRKVNDGFKTTEEIKNIKGFGNSRYDKIKDLIKVGG